MFMSIYEAYLRVLATDIAPQEEVDECEWEMVPKEEKVTQTAVATLSQPSVVPAAKKKKYSTFEHPRLMKRLGRFLREEYYKKHGLK
jgi:hypothetical protein